MRFLPSVAVAAVMMIHLNAYADPHAVSMERCEQAIAERIGMTPEDTRLTLESVKSNGRYKDYRFSVKTAGGHRGAAECHARPSGSVTSLDVWGNLPRAGASS